MRIVRAWKSEPGELSMGRLAQDDKEELRLAAFGSRLVTLLPSSARPPGRGRPGLRGPVLNTETRLTDMGPSLR